MSHVFRGKEASSLQEKQGQCAWKKMANILMKFFLPYDN